MEEQNTTGESIESVSFKSVFFKKNFRTSIKYFLQMSSPMDSAVDMKKRKRLAAL